MVPWQRGLGLDHILLAWQVAELAPSSRYPGVHVNDTVPPSVKTLPDFTPLSGEPGSPQLTAVRGKLDFKHVFYKGREGEVRTYIRWQVGGAADQLPCRELPVQVSCWAP